MNRTKEIRFAFLKELNQAKSTSWFNSKAKHSYSLLEYCTSTSLRHTLIKKLIEHKVLPIKEILECTELFERTHKYLQTPQIADLCCGHGLLGVLFALFERSVEKVYLVDKNEPESRQKLMACVHSFAPWVHEKIVHIKDTITPEAPWLQTGTSIISAHACGTLTDRCIDIAVHCKGPIALMPCCYPRASCTAPAVLERELGLTTAFDIDRTYRLEREGYYVRWAHIPPGITPMNRIIIGTRIS